MRDARAPTKERTSAWRELMPCKIFYGGYRYREGVRGGREGRDRDGGGDRTDRGGTQRVRRDKGRHQGLR